jgi:hypothetical protein
LKHLEEQLFQPQVRSPIDGSQIVTMMELAMIEELLAGPGEVRNIVAADQAGKRFLPANSQPLELLEKGAVD